MREREAANTHTHTQLSEAKDNEAARWPKHRQRETEKPC